MRARAGLHVLSKPEGQWPGQNGCVCTQNYRGYLCVEEMEHPNTWCHWVSRIRPVWERNSSNLLIYSCKCNEKCESECTVSVTLAVNKAANEIRAFFTAEQCRRHAGSRSRLNNRPVLTASCLSGDMREKRNAHVTKMWQQLLTHGLTSCCPTNLESRKE